MKAGTLPKAVVSLEDKETTPCLHLADGLNLPLEAVTETFAILAKRGSGKTYTAAVLVEEMLLAGQTVVVADPVGVWWGLRSAADGTGPGLPIIILGGDHADVPLSAEAGPAVADLAAEERFSLVLDLSHFTPPEQTRFMTGFAERLYHANRLPLHLVLDEADQFVPQTPEAGQQPLLWAMNRIVRLGRARGLGVTLISQRPAVLAKNVLTQAEVLITLRLTSPQDRKAVEAWVSAHDDAGHRQEMLASLASLPVGTAWLWSPGWLDLLQKVQVRRRHTFDSSATPKVSQGKVNQSKTGSSPLRPDQLHPEPAALAAVDLDRVRTRLADLMPASSEANTTETDTSRRRTVTVTERVEVPIFVEVPVLDAAQAAQLQKIASALLAHAEALRGDLDKMTAAAAAILTRLDQVPIQGTAAIQSQAPALLALPFPAPVSSDQHPAPEKPTTEQPVAPIAVQEVEAAHPEKGAPPAKAVGEKMPLAERRILTALAQHPGGRRKSQVALLTGYAVGGGGFNNALSALRSKGWISGKDLLTISDLGCSALGDWEPLPAAGPALAAHWQAQLPKAERLILQALVEAHPHPLTKDQVGTATGYASTGGGFNNALSRLRTLELIEGRAELHAAALLCAVF